MQSSRLVSAFVKGLLALSVLPSILARDLAHAVRITNEPNGFNEYTWGEPPASLPALQQTRERSRAEGCEQINAYAELGEVLTLHGAMLKTIRYRFVDDRLESI